MTSPDPRETTALGDWVDLAEGLTRGVVHALNNRITALSGITELATSGEGDPRAARMIPTELKHLHEVNALLRLLLQERAAAEGLEVAPVLRDAILLHGHHATLRGVQATLAVVGEVPPVRVPRWALLRLALLALVSAKQGAVEAGASETTIVVQGGGEDAVVTFANASAPGDYAAAMAVRCGGTLEVTDAGATLRLPTLATLRARERSARDLEAREPA
jgi:hypothetical protein